MKADLYNQKGEKSKKIDISEAVFGVKVNKNIISQYVYSFQNNQRESNAHTKDRSEVSGGGRKPWKQKGTGRARFGSSRNPIWVGGGVAFGPTNSRNFKKVITKKFKLAALKHALSSLMSEDSVQFTEELEINDKKPLTKQALELLKNFKIDKKATIVVANNNDLVLNAFSNVKKVKVVTMDELNPYDVISAGKILIDEKALHIIENKFSK